jgi:hypothetical protein
MTSIWKSRGVCRRILIGNFIAVIVHLTCLPRKKALLNLMQLFLSRNILWILGQLHRWRGRLLAHETAHKGEYLKGRCGGCDELS